jgi:hypothetical protein
MAFQKGFAMNPPKDFRYTALQHRHAGLHPQKNVMNEPCLYGLILLLQE